jgi:hypothetical protein
MISLANVKFQAGGATQRGGGSVRFSDVFGENLRAFGMAGAWRFYSKRGMSLSEFGLWVHAALAAK